jgi:predicted aspartyl protease
LNQRLVSSRFPYLSIAIRLRQSPESVIRVDAYLDTGFTGGILLPRSFVAAGLSPDGDSTWALANGERETVPYYFARIEVKGLEPGTESECVIGGEEPLLGLAVLDQFRVTFDHGRRVIVEP